MATIKYYEKHSPSGYIRFFAQIDEYVVELPPTPNLRRDAYIRGDVPDGVPVRYIPNNPFLPNYGSIRLPDGRKFRVMDHCMEEMR
jgi:hypothetical protein